MADLNESVNKKDGIAQRLNHQCLLNLTKFNQCESEIPTHKRGSKQIDTIMCSQMISTYITQASFQPFDEICESDHRSMHIDIKLKYYIHDKK